MSDTGNTASQVSPSIPTEQEMTTIRSMFERAANAIVQASELSVKLGELEARFNQLQADMEAQRRRNQELDEFLAHTRRQRDEAEHNLSVTQGKLTDSTHGWEAEVRAHQDTKSELERVRSLNSNLAHDNDKLQHELAQAIERANQAEAKLSDIQSHMQDVFGLMTKAQLEPTPAPSPEPSPQVAESRPTTKKVYEGEQGFDWHRQPQPEWDDAARRWSQEVAA